MRAYYIRITNPTTGKVVKFYTSFKPDGSTNGAALRIEFDIPIYSYETPGGLAKVKVYGVDFPDIQAQSDLNGMDIEVYGGMAKGLPLANPAQAGILVKGTVFQCFGNWVGREVSLELFIVAKAAQANLAYKWPKGGLMEAAVRQALNIAYPGSTVTGGFSPSLVYTEDQPFAYQNLTQLAKFVFDTSKTIVTDPAYLGARIIQNAKGFILSDGTNQPTAKQISYLDLVGNATWIEPQVMQFMCVMRADLSPGDIVQMPKGANQVNQQNSFSQFRNKTAFQGNFFVRSLRHLGDSRQLSAESWVTVVEGIPQP